MTLDIYRDFEELEDRREANHGDHLAGGPVLTLPNLAARERYVRAAERLADMQAMRAMPQVRVELDAAGRIMRAWVRSLSNKAIEHELVRTGDGWEHVGQSCPAASGTCYHVKALLLLDARESLK